MPEDRKKLLIGGGGTGGHVNAGLAIAQAWKQKFGENSDVLFIGAKGRMEEKLLPPTGFSARFLHVGSLNRVSLNRKFITLILLPFAVFHSLILILRFRPQAAIGVGGYSAGPVLLAARILGALRLGPRKIGVMEQNSVLGMTNRWCAKLSDVLFFAFSGSEDRIRTQYPQLKITVSGNPIRSEFRKLPPAKERPPRVFILGGSQGAKGLNQLWELVFPTLLKKYPDLEVLHQTGEIEYERVQNFYQKVASGKSGIRVEKYVFEMKKAYEEATLLVCRAGASTLFELSAVGRASVLVPLPTAADNHQMKNALLFQEKEAAVVVDQNEDLGRGGARLLEQVSSLLDDFHRIHELESNICRFYQPEAAKTLVEELAIDV